MSDTLNKTSMQMLYASLEDFSNVFYINSATNPKEVASAALRAVVSFRATVDSAEDKDYEFIKHPAASQNQVEVKSKIQFEKEEELKKLKQTLACLPVGEFEFVFKLSNQAPTVTLDTITSKINHIVTEVKDNVNLEPALLVSELEAWLYQFKQILDDYENAVKF